MKRREFITLVGGAAAWPLAARTHPVKLSITHISPRLSADAILRILESDESFVIPS